MVETLAAFNDNAHAGHSKSVAASRPLQLAAAKANALAAAGRRQLNCTSAQ